MTTPATPRRVVWPETQRNILSIRDLVKLLRFAEISGFRDGPDMDPGATAVVVFGAFGGIIRAWWKDSSTFFVSISSHRAAKTVDTAWAVHIARQFADRMNSRAWYVESEGPTVVFFTRTQELERESVSAG